MEDFQLRELSIKKAPGLRKGLEKMDLAKNINIIAGPNASGKSSTAGVIQKLIWPEQTKGLQVEASIFLGQEDWEVKIDSGHVQLQRNGLEDILKGIPASETSSRYLLALHELISGEETELAARIAKESIGGISLEDSHQNLGYYGTIASKKKTEYVEWKERNRNLKVVKDGQEGLKREETRLQQLIDQKKAAQLAGRLQQLYGARKEYLIAKRKVDGLHLRQQEFPAVMQKVTGGEFGKLEELEQQIGNAAEQIELFKSQVKSCQKNLEQLQLSAEGFGEQKETELQKRVEYLRGMSRDMEDLEQRMAVVRETENCALAGLDEDMNISEWKGLRLEDVGELDPFLQEAHSVLGQRAFLLAEIELLESGLASLKETAPSENLTNGIRTLSAWLKEESSTRSVAKGSFVILAILGCLTALATYLWGLSGLAGIALLGAYVTYSLRFPQVSATSSREQDFLELQLAPPLSWQSEHVAKRLEELVIMLRLSKQQEILKESLNKNYKKLDQTKQRLQKLEEKRENLWRKLGTAPGFSVDNEHDFSSLYWFIKHARDWQEAHSQAEALQAQHSIYKLQFKGELKKLNLLFRSLNFEPASDAIQAAAIFQEIKRQESRRKEESSKLGQAQEKIAAKIEEKEKESARLLELYENLGFCPGEKNRVRELCIQLPAYKQVCQDAYAAGEVVADKQRQLEDHPLYKKYIEQMEHQQLEEVQDALTKYAADAGKLDELNRDITRIETLIKSKKRGDELEDALTDTANALSGLSRLYQENLSAITGDLLVEQLKEETRDQNRPKIFKRASELLSRITNGRYELLLDERGIASFGARDTVLKLGQKLSELSTGTRVQLLLAVRLAFIESVESGVRLPILADELLANSDDERATAIIHALIEISKENRQVFYFTAQEDEVAKWHALLKGDTDLEYKILSIGAEKAIPAPQNIPLLNPLVLVQPIPAPGAHSHENYGRLLQVSPFDPLGQECSELPLWYLLEDTRLLYACMKRGLSKWGQLDSFFRNKGKLEGLTEDSWQLASNRIKLLERYVELVRRGKSRNINREVLENSGAISSNFMEEVHRVLKSHEGDPKKLLWGLRNGKVSKFRNTKVDELERYLKTEGYLNSHKPLTEEEISIRLNAFASQHLIDPEDVRGFFERILRSQDLKGK